MLIKKIDISRLMCYVEKIEGKKLKERRMKESKRAQFDGRFCNARNIGGNGLPQQVQRFQGQGSNKITNPMVSN